MARAKAPDKINKSTQEMQNLGFDTEFNLPTAEALVYNPTTSAIDRMVQPQIPSITPTVYNVVLTTINTEYSQALPANTREYRFRCRTLYDVRFAFVTGKVATPTAPYLVLPAGSDYYSDSNKLAAQTIYFASAEAGVIVEIECWT